jgi:NhaP-type Na+/H+ or K+/H+ antiporter
MSLFSLMEPAERGSKYRYLSMPVIVVVTLISIGLFFWLAISLPWWVGLPAGVAVLATGFVLVLRLVNSIVPKKFPTGEDS